MQLNILGIVIATAVQFMIGAVWYSVLFGKLWGKIHGFDTLSKEVQEQMMKEMGPFYALQAFVTLLTSIIVSILAMYVSHDLSAFTLAFFLWIGLIVPAQVSAVIFGGTEKKWIIKKLAVQAGAAFVCLQVATFIIYFFS